MGILSVVWNLTNISAVHYLQPQKMKQVFLAIFKSKKISLKILYSKIILIEDIISKILKIDIRPEA